MLNAQASGLDLMNTSNLFNIPGWAEYTYCCWNIQGRKRRKAKWIPQVLVNDAGFISVYERWIEAG